MPDHKADLSTSKIGGATPERAIHNDAQFEKGHSCVYKVLTLRGDAASLEIAHLLSTHVVVY